MNSPRRLFIAIPASDRLQDHARRIRGKWLDLPLAWIGGRDLHITLIPPWETRRAADDIDRFDKMMLITKAFPLLFEEVSLGPDAAHPRLLWAHGPVPDGLTPLKQEIENFFGVSKDHRSFNLHLTLARFGPNALPALKRKKIDERVAWRETAQSIILMESIHGRDGIEYRTLAEKRLAG